MKEEECKGRGTRKREDKEKGPKRGESSDNSRHRLKRHFKIIETGPFIL